MYRFFCDNLSDRRAGLDRQLTAVLGMGKPLLPMWEASDWQDFTNFLILPNVNNSINMCCMKYSLGDSPHPTWVEVS